MQCLLTHHWVCICIWWDKLISYLNLFIINTYVAPDQVYLSSKLSGWVQQRILFDVHVFYIQQTIVLRSVFLFVKLLLLVGDYTKTLFSMYWVQHRISFELIYVMVGESSLENREHGRRDPSHWPRGTHYPQKSALTSPTSGGHSVSIVCSWTQATENGWWILIFCCILLCKLL
jgi:hypothetical protein